jgi:hypothetical protein
MDDEVALSSMQITITVISPEQRSEIAGVNKFFVYTLRGKDSKGNHQTMQEISKF